jgi:hypothetical protein
MVVAALKIYYSILEISFTYTRTNITTLVATVQSHLYGVCTYWFMPLV